MNRKTLMKQLHITYDEICLHPESVTEKLFLAAILSEGTDIAERVLRKFHELKDMLKEG